MTKEKTSATVPTKTNSGSKPAASLKGGKNIVKKSMNPPAKTNAEVIVYSKEFCANLKKHENAVKSGFTKAGKCFFEVAFNLYWIHKNNAFKAAGKDNIYDYGREKFDLARGTIHNYIAVAERFGRPALESDMLTIREEYAAYSPTQLCLLAPLSDDAIKSAEISPTMSTREIKKKITAFIANSKVGIDHNKNGNSKAGNKVDAAKSAETKTVDKKDDTGTSAPVPVRQVLLAISGSDDYLKHEETMLELLHNLLSKKPNARVEISYFVETPVTSAEEV